MIKFCYNPINKVFFGSELQGHTALVYNHDKSGKSFDKYIRGIIEGNTLYLRTYYPYNDIAGLSLAELNKKSLSLLSLYIKDLTKAIKTEYGFIPAHIVYNAVNDLLKEDLQVNFI